MKKLNNLNKQEKIRLSALLIAILVLALVLFQNYRQSRMMKKNREDSRKTARVLSQKGDKVKKLTIAKKEKPIEIREILRTSGRENPFLRVGEKKMDIEVNEKLPEVSGITVDGSGAPLVIIDEVFLREGDVFRNIKILKINEKSVIVERNGEEHEMFLGS